MKRDHDLLRESKNERLTSKDEEKEAVELPPRKLVHRSEKWKWTKLFYRSLIVIFSVLIVGLLVWGFLLQS